MAKRTLAKQREAPGAGRGPPVTPQNVPTAPALPAFLPASAATTAAHHLRHGPAARLPAPPFPAQSPSQDLPAAHCDGPPRYSQRLPGLILEAAPPPGTLSGSSSPRFRVPRALSSRPPPWSAPALCCATLLTCTSQLP